MLEPKSHAEVLGLAASEVFLQLQMYLSFGCYLVIIIIDLRDLNNVRLPLLGKG